MTTLHFDLINTFWVKDIFYLMHVVSQNSRSGAIDNRASAGKMLETSYITPVIHNQRFRPVGNKAG
jgi:hypothetical protein